MKSVFFPTQFENTSVATSYNGIAEVHRKETLYRLSQIFHPHHRVVSLSNQFALTYS
jgi:hypothetical protein